MGESQVSSPLYRLWRQREIDGTVGPVAGKRERSWSLEAWNEAELSLSLTRSHPPMGVGQLRRLSQGRYVGYIETRCIFRERATSSRKRASCSRERPLLPGLSRCRDVGQEEQPVGRRRHRRRAVVRGRGRRGYRLRPGRDAQRGQRRHLGQQVRDLKKLRVEISADKSSCFLRFWPDLVMICD